MSQISFSKYCKENFYTLDNYTRRVENLDINFFQKSALKIINQENSIVSIIKQRQKGITSALALYVTYLIASKSKYKDIFIMCPNSISRASFIQKVMNIMYHSEIFNDRFIMHTKRDEIRYLDYRVKTIGQSKDSLRGWDIDILIVDDAAQMMDLEDIFKQNMLITATGGRVIYTSTPTGSSMNTFKKFHLKLANEMCIYRKEIIVEKKQRPFVKYNEDACAFNICYEKKALQAL